jgi:acetyl-CoA C-acetyltransferase
MYGFRHRDGMVLFGGYLKRFGYSEEESRLCNAAMAQQIHKFARMNPKASLYGTPCPTREELNGPHALNSMMGEGSGCVILVSEEEAYKYNDKPIWIEGLGYSNTSHYIAHRIHEEPMGPDFPEWLDRTSCEGISVPGVLATKKAYEMAGVSAEQIDVAQVYDLGTTAITLVEALGLCPIGEGGRCFLKGDFDLGGRCPVDTDGGNIARGHSSGADGLFQVAENVIQLRGQAGERQVKGAKLAASCNVGSVHAHVTTIVLGNDDFHTSDEKGR